MFYVFGRNRNFITDFCYFKEFQIHIFNTCSLNYKKIIPMSALNTGLLCRSLIFSVPLTNHDFTAVYHSVIFREVFSCAAAHSQ